MPQTCAGATDAKDLTNRWRQLENITSGPCPLVAQVPQRPDLLIETPHEHAGISKRGKFYGTPTVGIAVAIALTMIALTIFVCG